MQAGRKGGTLGLLRLIKKQPEQLRHSMTGLWLCFSRVIFTPNELLVLVEMSSVVQCFLWLPAKPEAPIPSPSPTNPRVLQDPAWALHPLQDLPCVPVMSVAEHAQGPGRGTRCRCRASTGDSLPLSSFGDQCQQAPHCSPMQWLLPHLPSHSQHPALGQHRASLPVVPRLPRALPASPESQQACLCILLKDIHTPKPFPKGALFFFLNS